MNLWTPTGNTFQTQIDVKIEHLESILNQLERDRLNLEIQLMQVDTDLNHLILNIHYIKETHAIAVSLKEFFVVRTNIKEMFQLKTKIIASLKEIDKLIKIKEDEIDKLRIERVMVGTKILQFRRANGT